MQMEDWKKLARDVSRGEARGMTILRERGQDVRIARTLTPLGDSVVVKLWNRPGITGLLRRLSRTNAARREWMALVRLRQSGIMVPEPLAYVQSIPDPAAHTEAMISGDLGPCDDAVEYLKELIRRNDLAGEHSFTSAIVESTAAMVRLGLLDVDHRLPNFVVGPPGLPVRLDFELNVRRPWPELWTRKYGLMLGTLLGSYVFAVQPDRQRVIDFAGKLSLALNPPRRVLLVAEARMREMLLRQEREIGLKMEVDNPWGKLQ
jgi:hypothetical protein